MGPARCAPYAEGLGLCGIGGIRSAAYRPPNKNAMSKPSFIRNLASALLLTLLTTGAFQARAQVMEINTGAPNTPLYAVGPIYVSSTLFYRYSRFAYLYTQAELAAAGIVPGTVIQSAGWMKSTANSTAGPAVFTIYMKNSSATAYSGATALWTDLSAGASVVYTEPAQSIPADATPNYIDFPLSAPFTYTGGSLEVLTEWDISTAPAPIATGAFEWENTTVVDRIYASGGTSLPATLSSTTNNVAMDDRRPVVRFTVELPTGVRQGVEVNAGLWPNPTDGQVNISSRPGDPIERIEVINALGRVVMVESPSTATSDQRVDLSGLGAGQYMVRIQTGAGQVMKHVVVR